MEPNFSISEENYIKSVYHLQQQEGTVSTNALAQHLKTAPASITDMLKKLHAKRIVHYKPYKGFTLSKEGIRVALNVIRKHRLWEFFLVDTLRFSWEEVHEVAEQLEHINSIKLIDKLDAFLNYPRFDPHGDPIPDSNGKISAGNHLKLSKLPVNKPAVVISVASQSAELLEFLKNCNIKIGTRMEIKKRLGFDNSVEIKIKNRPLINVSEQLANAVNVKPV